MSTDVVSELLERIDTDLVKFIRLQFSDIQGLPKNVAIPAAQAEKALTEGIWFDGSSIEGFCRIEESDMLLKPDPSSYPSFSRGGPRTGAWPGSSATSRPTAASRSRATALHPEEDDRRGGKGLGFTFNTGPETRVLPLRDAERPAHDPVRRLRRVLNLAPTTQAEDVRRQIVLALTDMGFDMRRRTTR